MLRKPVVLITGAGGEIGHGLITPARARPAASASSRSTSSRSTPRLAASCTREFTGSILDDRAARAHPRRVRGRPRLPPRGAALDARSEFTPVTAHQVNVEGTLTPARVRPEAGRVARAARGVRLSVARSPPTACPTSRREGRAGRVQEDEWTRRRRRCTAATSCTASSSARYYARHYKQLAAETLSGQRVDFRCVRFPGLISAVTVPSGGTSDFAPEMIHAAARGEAVRLLRAAGHAHPVHGDARRGRGAAAAGGRAALAS